MRVMRPAVFPKLQSEMKSAHSGTSFKESLNRNDSSVSYLLYRKHITAFLGQFQHIFSFYIANKRFFLHPMFSFYFLNKRVRFSFYFLNKRVGGR